MLAGDPPDIEGLLIDWFPGVMAGVGWTVTAGATLVPIAEGESLAVYRVGGPLRDIVTDSPTLSIDAKGRTRKRSHDILSAARKLVHGLETTSDIGATVQRVQEFSGPGFLPSADSPTRYTMNISLDVSLV